MEGALFFIEDLDDSDDAAGACADGNAKDIACAVAEELIDLRVEAVVIVRIGEKEGFAVSKDVTSDAFVAADADLAGGVRVFGRRGGGGGAFGDRRGIEEAGVELVGFVVVEKDGAAIRLEDVGGDLNHLLEQLIEGEGFGDIADHLK